mgnify:CR=1 FL=1
MNVFDIIGPVMVGPSSSHTAGAVRIGRVARALLGLQPVEAIIKLHGSFAKTYKGHGTDKAIIAGLLGFQTDDLRIRNSMEFAAKMGMKYRFETIDLKGVHPNTALIEVIDEKGNKISVLGSSVGGGNIEIKQVNGMDVEFTGQYTTLVIPHRDTPGTIAEVTNLLGNNSINIAQMKVFRSHRGGNAMMIIETDQRVGDDIKDRIWQMPNILGISVVEPV